MRRLLLILSILLIGCGQPVVDHEVAQVDDFDESYSFNVDPVEGYNFRRIGDGVLMRKVVKGMKNDKESEYWVEIGIFGDGGEGHWRDVSALVATKYPGFSYQYAGDDVADGIFVDDYDNGNAVKHFFVMNDDVLYEAYMKVPSYFYAVHEGEFMEVVKGLTFS